MMVILQKKFHRLRDENHLGILALCCRRPKEITGRISFFSPSFSNINTNNHTDCWSASLRSWALEGSAPLLRAWQRGGCAAPEFRRRCRKAHQKKPSGAALDLHLADGAVGFDDVCLISYLHGVDHVLTILWHKHSNIFRTWQGESKNSRPFSGREFLLIFRSRIFLFAQANHFSNLLIFRSGFVPGLFEVGIHFSQQLYMFWNIYRSKWYCKFPFTSPNRSALS